MIVITVKKVQHKCKAKKKKKAKLETAARST